jgi:superfamily II DNA or RNA helicase
LITLPALEPYQTQAVDAAVLHLNTRRSGVLVAPAGSGKTWICAAIVEAIDCRRVLCLVPTQEIVGQMQAACELFGVADRVDVRCYQGRPDAAGYDLLIIDEAHTAASGKCGSRRWRFGRDRDSRQTGRRRHTAYHRAYLPHCGEGGGNGDGADCFGQRQMV